MEQNGILVLRIVTAFILKIGERISIERVGKYEGL